MTSSVLPEHCVLAIGQSKRDQIDVLEKLGDGEEVDETVALFAADGLVSESLDVEEVGDQVWRVGFDN